MRDELLERATIETDATSGTAGCLRCAGSA